MPFSVAGYQERARECITLANQAKDQMIRVELLKLRQTYLNIAERLRRQGFETEYPRQNAFDSHEA
jgi:hypothetical protein